MKTLLSTLLALAICVPLAAVQAQVQERTPYSQAELDQMLAPVSLYPDALLSQVLMASTYPLEVVQAARWSRARSALRGDEAVRAAQDQDWDPSVKSLLAFPGLLARMDDQLEWTRRLGDAFLEQEPMVMETVQQLRRKARAAGQLAPDERQHVVERDGNIAIEPANAQVVYLPYYDPLVVYGTWWWPAYPPIAWAPWPGYVANRPGVWWGAGVGISAGFFFGGVSWSQRHVHVVRVSPYYVRPPSVRRAVVAHRPIALGPWQHDFRHRRGVEYRSPVVQRRFVPNAPARTLRARPPAEPRIAGPEMRRHERRDDRRGHAMPPAFRASTPAATEVRPRAARPSGTPTARPDARRKSDGRWRERGTRGRPAEVRFGRAG